MDALLGLTGLTPAITLGMGLVIGLEHALEPDHVAAVSTQSSETRTAATSRSARIRSSMTRSSLLGAVWGAGHATSLVLFGMLVYMTVSLIQDWVFQGFEAAAGVMLLGLGITAILGRSIFGFGHAHPHIHKNGTVHSHKHDHDGPAHRHTHKSYAIGLVHGLAGSGGIVAVAAATLADPGTILAFMLIFGAGAVIGMCAVGGLLGIPLALAGRRKRIRRAFRYVAGAFGIVLGTVIVYGAVAPGFAL